MLGFLPFSGVASAQTARDTDDACPADAPDAFTDDEGNVHEDNINCVAFWEIVRGTTATTYSPRTGTTRAQMASIIAQLIDTAAEGGGTALTADPPNAFTDDDTSVHHNNINRLAAAEVVNGTSPTTFTPQALVTRAQMASFIAQGIDYINDGDVDGDLPPAATQDHFGDDDTSVHEDNINRLAEQDIVVGTGPAASGTGAADHNGNFSPQSMVFRDQTASFAAQAADFLAENGFWPPVPGGAIQATATEAPELLSVAQESHSGTTLIMRYKFDEPLSGNIANPALFHLYAFNSDDSFNGATAALLTGDATTVRVQFNGINAQTLGLLTLATVDAGAVNDPGGIANPEGDAPFKAATTGAQSSTEGPDLIEVTNPVATPGIDTTTTDIQFVFDEAASEFFGGYFIVLLNGTVIECDLVAGDTTATHTVRCDNPGGSTTPIPASNIARGYVDADAVWDPADDSQLNPLQAADVTGNATTPSLVSITIDETQNRILYNFSEPVRFADDSDALGDGTTALDGWTAYFVDGDEVMPVALATSSADRSVVIAQFDPTVVGSGDITADTVGANVQAGEVEERIIGEGRTNAADEERRAADAGTAVPAGSTNGPDLTGVSKPVVAATDIQGQPTAYAVTYTFDENVDTAACGAATLFRIYLPNGTQIQGDSVNNCGNAGTNPPGANQVRVLFDPAELASDPNPANAVSGGVDDGAVEDSSGFANPEGYEVMPTT